MNNGEDTTTQAATTTAAIPPVRPHAYPPRPDIKVRNKMKAELGRWPNPEELQLRLQQMGFKVSDYRGRQTVKRGKQR